MPGQEVAYHQTALETDDEERVMNGRTSALQGHGRELVERGHFRWNVLAASSGALAALLLICFVANSPAAGKVSETATKVPDDHGPTIRQLMEGPELNQVMTDNLMKLGGISEPQRPNVEEHVAVNVRQLSDQIHKMSPSIDRRIDNLEVSEEQKEQILKVMSSLSDDRMKSIMEDMAVALHQAMNTSMGHSEFKQLITQCFEARKQDFLELRDELYSESNEKKENFEQALYASMDRSQLMKAFDRWSQALPATPAQARRMVGKDPGDRGLRNDVAPEYDGAVETDPAVTDQLREFYREVAGQFHEEFHSLADEWRQTLSPSALKAAVHDNIAGMKQDMLEHVAVMREDIHDAFSPVAIRQNLDYKVAKVQQAMHESIGEMKAHVHQALSPESMKVKMQDFFSSYRGAAPVGDHNDAGVGRVSPGHAVEQGTPGLMECVAQFFEAESEGLMTCAIHAMTYCLDMVRSLAAP